MSSRPSRRVTRRAVVESSDEEAVGNSTQKVDDSEDEFTPVPSGSPKGNTGRRTTATVRSSEPSREAAMTGKRRGRSKKSAAPTANIEPTELSDPDPSTTGVMEDAPVKKATSRGRKSAAPLSRASLSTASRTPERSLQAAKLSTTPEPELGPSQSQSKMALSPSADMGNAGVKDQRRSPDDSVLAAAKPVKAMDTIMERPMDIVLKTRNVHVPVVEDTGPRARLVINNLFLVNFKSYAGRQEVGPFHASFSSVVGPNGSGKSNVIDSLLFVFGFRASKMRQGKLSALIHNSAQHPNLEFCEVAVHFQEVMDLAGGGHEVIPNSSLVVSRKAFKNNSSQYYLDGKSSNFTAVTTLLRDRGIDLDHKRFLILQGEVESIAQMKAKAANEHDDGLLEYLEDIIGTSKYKAPIEESAGQVETLNEICMEKSGRVQHVEKEKNSLEDKKNKALSLIRDENELAMKRSALYQLHISECQDNLAVTAEAIEQMQSRLEAELENHKGSEQMIKQLEKAYTKGNLEVEARALETQGLIKEMTKCEQERVKSEEKRKFLADKCKKVEKSMEKMENLSEEACRTMEECAQEIATGAGENAKFEEQIKAEDEELVRIRDRLKGKTQAFSDQIAAKQRWLEPWKEKINQKQSAMAVAESEMVMLKEKANAGAVALEEVEAKIASIEEGREAKAEEMKSCQAEKIKLEKEADKIKAELDKIADEEPKIRAQLSNARQKADEARSSLSATQNRSNVLTALVRMRDSGRIDGFHGRLGNLGTIEQRYDVAISTACGALDNFVTETVDAGQQCIEYLRKTNLGRGNFICLDKLRVRDLSGIHTPENAPRLFDLVKAKEDKFRPAFYQALQDTLVATDLAQANRIAYGAKRWRVVTLDGELIDKSGTMSGGGSSRKKGLMSSKLAAENSKEQVGKLEGDRDFLEQKFHEFQDHQRTFEDRLRSLRGTIPQLETRLQKIHLEMESSARNLADARRRSRELAKEYQPSETDHDRIVTLEKEIAKVKKEIEKLHGETSSVEDEIKALQDKIMEVGGERLRAQKAKIDSLKEAVASRNEEISKAEVKKAKAEKQKIKLQKDQTKATRELEAAVAESERLEEEMKKQMEKAECLDGRVEEAREALSVKKNELAEMKAELDEKMAELNATRATEIEMRNKLEENQKVLVENQKRLRQWEEKSSKLVLQDVADLESGGKAGRKAGMRAAGEKEGNEDSGGIGGSGCSGDSGDSGDSEEEDVDPEAQLQAEAEATLDHTIHGPGTRHPLQLPRYTKDELADMSKDRLKADVATLEEKTRNVNVDLSVLSEYRRRVEEHAARSSDLATALGQRDAAKKRCDDLRRLRLEGFMHGFATISLRLKEMYQMITMGGNAELELVDSLDPFSEGILFSVMPPKKSWKNISNLSGGEKTLSSLALVFALHHYKPTPLYVMDEIDAALDFRNVSIVANYIKERTKNAQFIVISLRNNMFELAARLVGVYKVNHMTKSVTIENRDYVLGRQAATQQPTQSRTQSQTMHLR